MTFEFTVDTDDSNDRIEQASDEIEEITAIVEIEYTKDLGEGDLNTVESHIAHSIDANRDSSNEPVVWDDLIDTLQPFVDCCDFITAIVVTPNPPHDDLPDEVELGASVPTSTNINIIPGLRR